MESTPPNYRLLVMIVVFMVLALGVGFWGVRLFDIDISGDEPVPATEQTPDNPTTATPFEKKAVVPSQSSLDVESGMEVDVAATAIGSQITNKTGQASVPTDTEEEDEPDLSVQ